MYGESMKEYERDIRRITIAVRCWQVVIWALPVGLLYIAIQAGVI